MVKFDASALRYLSRDDFRVLTSIEMGMKNHDLVPFELIASIAGLKRPLVKRCITNIHKLKLVFHERKHYDGYRLTYRGYDYLALRTFTARGTIVGVGNKLGVGKEADIFLVVDEEGNEMILKLHRLGRTSFRSVRANRDYLKHRQSVSWMYMSRLAAMKEFAFMKVLYENNFPVPKPIDNNRHAIVMQLIPGYQLNSISIIRHPRDVYNVIMELIIRLAKHGLIHCDLNEFNLIIDDNEKITLIDFPQMVSTEHLNAEMYFDRDVKCISLLFEKRFGFLGESPKFSDYKEITQDDRLDRQVEASGFSKKHQTVLEQLMDENDEKFENEAEAALATSNENTKDKEDEKEEDNGEDEEEEDDDDDSEEDTEEGDNNKHGLDKEEIRKFPEEEYDPEEVRRELLERNRRENLTVISDGESASTAAVQILELDEISPINPNADSPEIKHKEEGEKEEEEEELEKEASTNKFSDERIKLIVKRTMQKKKKQAERKQSFKKTRKKDNKLAKEPW